MGATTRTTAPTPGAGHAPVTRRPDGPYARGVEQADALAHRDVIEAAYRRHYRAIVRVCRERTSDPSRAEDLAQETLIRALRYGHRVDTSRSLLPWLRTIALRVVIDDAALAANQRETVVDLTDTDELVVEDFAGVVGDHAELSVAYGRLSTLHQTALRLRYLEDWSGDDTARFLGISRDACDQLVARAKVRLRKHLERLGQSAPVLAPFGPGGFVTRVRVALAQRRAGVAGWDATLTSIGAVAENVAIAIAFSIAVTTIPAAGATDLAGGAGAAVPPVATITTTSEPATTVGPSPGGGGATAGSGTTLAGADDHEDDGSEQRYRVEPDGPLADAAPTSADARIAEDEEEADIEVHGTVSVLGHDVGFADTHHRIPCDGTSQVLIATCRVIATANDELAGDDDPETSAG